MGKSLFVRFFTKLLSNPVTYLLVAIITLFTLYVNSAKHLAEADERCALARVEDNQAVSDLVTESLRNQVTELERWAETNREELELANARGTKQALLARDYFTQVEKLKNENEAYKNWADTPVPDGVVARLRTAGRGETNTTGDSEVPNGASPGNSD